MVYTCFLCKWRSDKLPQRSYHKFPSDHELKQKWLNILGKSNVSIGTRTCLCSLHFDENCFRYGLVNGRKILKGCSLPTLHLKKGGIESQTAHLVDKFELPSSSTESTLPIPYSSVDDVQMKDTTSKLHFKDNLVQVPMEICSPKGSFKKSSPLDVPSKENEILHLEKKATTLKRSVNHVQHSKRNMTLQLTELKKKTCAYEVDNKLMHVFAETCAGHSGPWDEVKVLAETCVDAGHSGLWDEVKVENTDIFDDVDNAVDDSDTLVDSNVCRVCLTLDVKMYDLKDIELREMFQNVTGIVVTENNHSILERLCWECAGRLKAAAGFRNKALLSHALLQGLADTGEQIRKNNITSIKENADYLKSAGTLSVAEVVCTVEIEPENESVPPISENNDTEIVQNIVKNEPIEMEECVFEDDHYQIDVKDELNIEDDIKTEIEIDDICHNTEERSPVVVNNDPFREDTSNSAYSRPQVEPKKRTLCHLLKTPSDCEDMTTNPLTKTTKRDAITKIVYIKSNPVISHHHTLIGDDKLKIINVKVGGIYKKTSNLKLVKKSQVKTNTDKECMSLEKK